MAHHAQPQSKGRRAAREHHREVQRFLSELSKAVTSGNGAAAAALWEVPAFVVGADMATPVASRDDVAKFFAGAKASYNARGITDTRAEILEEDWIDDRLVHVKVRWPYLDESGGEIGAEASDYLLARDGDGSLKVRVAVLRGVEGTDGSEPS